MAVSPKIPLLRVAVHDIALPPVALFPKSRRIDFASNPNNHRVNAKAPKSKPQKRALGVDMSPRLTLGLSVECESGQEKEDLM